jgi:hypothetical protein
MHNLTRIISGSGLALLTVAMLTVAPGWTADNSPEAEAAAAAAARCAAEAERAEARCQVNATPGTGMDYCIQRVQNRYNNCVGNLSIKASRTAKQRLETSGPGLLETGPGLLQGGPAAAGRPIAPTAPAAPPLVVR